MTEEAVKVAVRVRPFNSRESRRNAKCIIEMSQKSTTIYNPNNVNESRTFTFDYSYWSHDGINEDENGYLSPQSESRYIGQKELFQDIGVGILNNSWQGYNTTLFAYGQTGSGKSWSVFGYGTNKGIVPRFCEEMFNEINIKKSTGTKTGYEVIFSMLEIYNERVYDLLNPYLRSRILKVRQHPQKGFYADGLMETPVKNGLDIEHRIEQGMRNRTIAETKLNESSSRAHTIIGVTFIQKTTNSSGVETAKSSVINLVDLAGSERATRRGASADHVKEGAAINQSLSNLGNCIAALVERSEGRNVRVPFRYSALTKLLKNALVGNSKTIMIAALSPADINYEETLSTLRYADRAKQIKTKATINEDPTAKLIRELQEENDRLQKMFGDGKMENMTSIIKCEEDEDSVTEEVTKTNLEEEFAARIAENERMLKEMERKWEEKLAEVENENREKDELKRIMAQEKTVTPHIYNLSPDPMLTEMIVFFLKLTVNSIGRDDEDPKPDIPLLGVNILQNHGQIKNLDSGFSISKNGESRILVNGVSVTGDVELHHNDRILIGTAHFYVFSNPEEKKKLEAVSTTKINIPTYESALEEIVFHSRIEDAKVPGILSRMVDFLPHLNEVNGLSEELDKKVQFEPIVITPVVKQLIADNDENDMFCKVTQLELGYTWFWSREKLLYRKLQMQEMFQKFQNKEEWDLPEDQDPFVDPIDSECLIGITQVYLKSLAYLLDITVKSPLIDYRGLKIGELEVSILPCTSDGLELAHDENCFQEKPEELIGKRVDFNILISQSYLPKRYTDVFCQYSIFTNEKICTDIMSASQNVVFDHSKHISIEVCDEDMLEYILSKSLIIEVFGKQKAECIKPINRAAELGRSTRQIILEEELRGRKASKKPRVSIDVFKTLSEYSIIDKRRELVEEKLTKVQVLCDTEVSKGGFNVPIADIQSLVCSKSLTITNSSTVNSCPTPSSRSVSVTSDNHNTDDASDASVRNSTGGDDVSENHIMGENDASERNSVDENDAPERNSVDENDAPEGDSVDGNENHSILENDTSENKSSCACIFI